MSQRCFAVVIPGLLLGCLLSATLEAAPLPDAPTAKQVDSPAARQEAQKLDQLPPLAPHGKPPIDHSGRKEQGRASYYAKGFAHRKMADGRCDEPECQQAASKTLLLGTTATVTNLKNGKNGDGQGRGPWTVCGWPRGRSQPQSRRRSGYQEGGCDPGGGKTYHRAAAQRGRKTRRRCGGCKSAGGQASRRDDKKALVSGPETETASRRRVSSTPATRGHGPGWPAPGFCGA